MNNKKDILLCAIISGYQGAPLSLTSGIIEAENQRPILMFLKSKSSNFEGKEK